MKVSRMSLSSVVEECYKKCSGRMELLHNTAGLLPIPKCNYWHSFYKGDRYGVSDGIGITHRVIKRQLNKRYYYSRLNNNGFFLDHKYNDLLASQTQLFNSTITDTRPKPLVELKKNGHVNISIPNLNISNFDGKISVRMLMLPESTVDSFIDRPKNKFDGYFYKQWMDCKQPERETFQERKRIKKPRIALSMFEEKKETMKEKAKRLVKDTIKNKNSISMTKTPMPIPKNPIPMTKTPMPIPKNPIPMTKTPIPIPKNPIPMTKTPMPIPKNPIPMTKTPIPIPKNPIPMTKISMPIPKNSMPSPKKSLPIPKNPIPITENPMAILENLIPLPKNLMRIPKISKRIPTNPVSIPNNPTPIPVNRMPLLETPILIPKNLMRIPKISMRVPKSPMPISEKPIQIPENPKPIPENPKPILEKPSEPTSDDDDILQLDVDSSEFDL